MPVRPYQNWFCEEQNEIRCKEKYIVIVYIINTYKRTHCTLELVTIQKNGAFAESNAPESKYLGKKQSISLEKCILFSNKVCFINYSRQIFIYGNV